jgi:hypothetical protein
VYKHSRTVADAKVCDEDYKQCTVATNYRACKSIDLLSTHAAAAPSTSCLLALVDRVRAVEKNNVVISNIL